MLMQIKALSIAYDHKIILDKINFSIPQGKIFAILGQSGSGKSSLLRTLMGLQKPQQGNIFYKNQDIYKISFFQHMGVVYQNAALFKHLTLIENLTLALENLTPLPKDACEFIALTKLSLVNLTEYAHSYPDKLSGGMQKKAALARALMMEPEIIFLDEPAAGLDQHTMETIDNLLLFLNQKLNITFILITHEIKSMQRIIDQAIVLADKKIVATGDLATIQPALHSYIGVSF